MPYSVSWPVQVLQREAGVLGIGITLAAIQSVCRLDAAKIAETDVIAYVTTDAQAGFGARDIEVAGAVDVADLDVFRRLRFGDDDSVGGARSGNCEQSRS